VNADDLEAGGNMNNQHTAQVVNQPKIEQEKLIKAWLKGRIWAIKVEWSLDAEQKWEFIKALVAAAPDKDALGSIGAGPLEDLLYGNTEDFIDRVEQEAAVNERFRFSLAIVRNPELRLQNPTRKEELQQRIERAVHTDANKKTTIHCLK
jgi:hypothetical protein